MTDKAVAERELGAMALEETAMRRFLAHDKMVRLERTARAKFSTAVSRAAFVGELRFLKAVRPV